MTPAQLDIARRLVAAPWFPKRGDGWTVLPHGLSPRSLDSNGMLWVYDRLGEYVPDLTYAGTGGVLLGMLADAVPGVETGYSAEWWVRAWTGAGWTRPGEGTTLAEATARVLLEVRGG